MLFFSSIGTHHCFTMISFLLQPGHHIPQLFGALPQPITIHFYPLTSLLIIFLGYFEHLFQFVYLQLQF